MENTAAPENHHRAKRNVSVLVACQAILGAQMPIHFLFGGLAGQMLATNKCFATLPISMTVLASMLSAPIMSSIMQNQGRRFGFVLGALSGATGAGVSVIGLYYGSFQLFLAGAFLTGIYMSAQGFYRFAATDTASDSFKPKAISWVMAGGLVSGILGPQLAKVSNEAIVGIPFAGAYMVMIGLNLIGLILFFALDIPKPPRAKEGDELGRSRGQLLRSPRIVVAMICAMVAYALMNLVMTSTPLAVVGSGYTKAHSADIVMGHVLAMFAPSFFTGHLIARFGVEKIIATGLGILMVAGIVALSGVALMNFYGALILLGLGWNFGFIGATAMLAAAHTPAERGRVQGMNDFAVFGMVTVASLASGGLMNCSGGSSQDGWTAVNIAMIPFLILAFAALIWLVVNQKRATKMLDANEVEAPTNTL